MDSTLVLKENETPVDDSFDLDSVDEQALVVQPPELPEPAAKDPFEALGESDFDTFFGSVDVNAMQAHLRSESSQEASFNNLYGPLSNVDWLRNAYQSVSRNSGANTPGVDGVTMRDFERDLDHNLETLAMLLEERSYKPHPVRRIYIPKASGGTRTIGIVAVRDRIVQEAMRMLLEPILEPKFSPHSYAYRRSQSTKDAVLHLRQIGATRPWVINADIKSYFDEIDHGLLMGLLARTIKDADFLKLVERFLNCNAIDESQLVTTTKGVPQGAIISPLLANLFLNELDTFLTEGYIHNESNPKNAIGFARYADDFVVLCHSKRQAQCLKPAIGGYLGSLRLELSPEKTHIVSLNRGIDFLGFKLKRRKGLFAPQVRITIPEGTQQQFVERIQTLTDPKLPQGNLDTKDESKISAINKLVSSWAHLYKTSDNAEQTYRKLDKLIVKSTLSWLKSKHNLSSRQARKRFKHASTLAAGGKPLLLLTAVLKNAE